MIDDVKYLIENYKTILKGINKEIKMIASKLEEITKNSNQNYIDEILPIKVGELQNLIIKQNFCKLQLDLLKSLQAK